MNLAMVKRNFVKFCHLLIIGIEILTGRYKKSGANERLALISIEIQLKMKRTIYSRTIGITVFLVCSKGSRILLFKRFSNSYYVLNENHSFNQKEVLRIHIPAPHEPKQLHA